MDPNQVLVGVYSVNGQSDEDGLAEVNIPIQPGWNNSLLFTLCALWIFCSELQMIKLNKKIFGLMQVQCRIRNRSYG